MIPAILNEQIKSGICDFLKTTFPFSTRHFHEMLDRFLEKEDTLFRGPYISIELPFQKDPEAADFFPQMPLAYAPYRHQTKAFKRLSGDQPESTIVATGTGSGKTECFLFPILNYCYAHRHQRGIKAILIYPMNALATDQSRRIAEYIQKTPAYKGVITAGLFVGDDDQSPLTTMSDKMVITDKDTMRQHPPDILMTNYKMLDFLMIRPKDKSIWQFNQPETLKYLVVDELHTFDGAQGTDLACLIRRLKARLKTPESHLVGIGTSATIQQKEAAASLIDYARKIFDEPFSESGIITEDRETVESFMAGHDVQFENIPVHIPDDFLTAAASPDALIKELTRLWFNSDPADVNSDAFRIELGEWLMRHRFFSVLLAVKGSGPILLDMLGKNIQPILSNSLPKDPKQVQLIIQSMAILIAHARRKTANGHEPFVTVRYQFWLNELSRMVATVAKKPEIEFSEHTADKSVIARLPVIHCRDCGSTGWGALQKSTDDFFQEHLKRFYEAFFNRNPDLTMFFPFEEDEYSDLPKKEGQVGRICGTCRRFESNPEKNKCPKCDGDLIRIWKFNPVSAKKRNIKCPFCRSKGGISILGSRAASLASIMISQLFASPFNDDKKLVAFSDSVQDAAHRAGFFSARTWNINFRAALNQMLKSQSADVPLVEAANRFRSYWITQKEMPQTDYVMHFLPSDMAWLEEVDELQKTGKLPQNSRLVQYLHKRIDWQLFSEFGYRARIGRTLEQSGCATLLVSPEKLEKAVRELLPVLKEENNLIHLDSRALIQFFHGFFTRLRLQGAIDHPDLKEYIQNSNTYLINKKMPWMPKFPPSSRLPRMLSDLGKGETERIAFGSAERNTWYEQWLIHFFGAMTSSVTPHLFSLILKALVSDGILKQYDTPHQIVYALDPEALQVTTKVHSFCCNRCKQTITVPQDVTELWKGMPCLRQTCHGQYEIGEFLQSFYRQLYDTADIQRIHAAEHTGLLKRDARIKLEEEFIHQPHSWNINLLSATPTLEMGINIGDLSTVLLCSVPPTTANYLQRIGRAGRKDGNSLALTISNMRPHDQYFFEEPLEMLAGSILSPDIFLDASAILERQFLAYCMDQWVGAPDTIVSIPDKLGQVLNNFELNKTGVYPATFQAFIITHTDRLLTGFQTLFTVDLSEESRKHLYQYVTGKHSDEKSLAHRLANLFAELANERKSYQKEIKRIRERITQFAKKEITEKGDEEELVGLRAERECYDALLKELNNKHTLNFFTDEGLLPNYAFPEAGIQLKSVIYRKRQKVDSADSAYQTWTYEYERPARSGIRELAPNSTFYASGRHVAIDQVNTSLSEFENWRFCPECTFSKRIQSQDTGDCPRCGHGMWSDEKQKLTMLRIKQVMAFTSDQDSRIQDDSDERQQQFFVNQMIADVDPAQITAGYQIRDQLYPFGFEFVAHTTFREINFGEADPFSQKEISIAGTNQIRPGFKVCKKCGKVQSAKSEHTEKPNHAISCPERNKTNGSAPEIFTDCLYLYREFDSEAVRLLVPVITDESSVKLQSFIAALHLGLRTFYGGKVDHLHALLTTEPVSGSKTRKTWLMLYDTVPGGTGYLKQLAQDDSKMMNILECALTALSRCSCQHSSEKDGCYRCLLAYRQAQDMPNISRRTAMTLLSEILAHKNDLVAVEKIQNINYNALFESELEERFISALDNYELGDIRCELKKRVVNMKPGYALHIHTTAKGNEKTTRVYTIEPQFDLNRSQGVGIMTRTDFLITPVGASTLKPIAVYTDGFECHQHSIPDDFYKRQAIVQSGNYWIWSIAWKDIPAHQPDRRYFCNHFAGFIPGNIEELFTSKSGLKGDHTNFEWLIHILANPDPDQFQRFFMAQAFMWLQAGRISDPAVRQSLIENMINQECRQSALWLEENEAQHAILAQIADPCVEKTVSIPTQTLSGIQPGQPIPFEALHTIVRVKTPDAVPEPEWIGLLHLYNGLQFLPRTSIQFQDQAPKEGWEAIGWHFGNTPTHKTVQAVDSSWQVVLAEVLPEFRSFIQALITAELPVPDIGNEILYSDGKQVLGDAEISWPEARIALLREDQMPLSEQWHHEQWQVFRLPDDLESQMELLTQLKQHEWTTR